MVILLPLNHPWMHGAYGNPLYWRTPSLNSETQKTQVKQDRINYDETMFCDGEGMVPTNLRPTRSFWAEVQKSVLPGELLFPSIQGSNLNRILKAILARMGVDSAERYTTKAFRWGASMDIMASGSTIAQITRSAGWHSQAFRAFYCFN